MGGCPNCTAKDERVRELEKAWCSQKDFIIHYHNQFQEFKEKSIILENKNKQLQKNIEKLIEVKDQKIMECKYFVDYNEKLKTLNKELETQLSQIDLKHKTEMNSKVQALQMKIDQYKNQCEKDKVFYQNQNKDNQNLIEQLVIENHKLIQNNKMLSAFREQSSKRYRDTSTSPPSYTGAYK